jgi:peptidyl-prolyl cis-trans isomerase SurA
MQVGQISGITRSPAGFHIVKLLEKTQPQRHVSRRSEHARHILVRVNEIVSESDAKAKDRPAEGADRFRCKVRGARQAQFRGHDLSQGRRPRLAQSRRHRSGIRRGDEEAGADQLSEPVRTPFGWHLIQVLERRKQDISNARERTDAQLAIRQRKADEAFQDWVRQIRDRAYVEVRLDDK